MLGRHFVVILKPPLPEVSPIYMRLKCRAGVNTAYTRKSARDRQLPPGDQWAVRVGKRGSKEKGQKACCNRQSSSFPVHLCSFSPPQLLLVHLLVSLVFSHHDKLDARFGVQF
ncbi:uncharacterized protein YALI1_C28661g [Yarrowia lipolytica]|uniref:Uncharacterized protein n=1 Tax=Yarrowia lipolytica TaxID=4952 RepID=A0A1D8NC09_YARLL|nr:hypothetical protein YALI1_C28661g [Yarrowia lipolytica]